MAARLRRLETVRIGRREAILARRGTRGKYVVYILDRRTRKRELLGEYKSRSAATRAFDEAKSRLAWFQRVVAERKGTVGPTGWRADDPAEVRRRRMIEAHFGDVLAAARACQALANVTKDPDTKKKARADAEYLFKLYKRLKAEGKARPGIYREKIQKKKIPARTRRRRRKNRR